MKSKLLLTAIAVGLSLGAYSQTKGTNALGFGVSMNSTKNMWDNAPTSKTESSSYNISYGHFIKDNTKIGLEFSYVEGENMNNGVDYSTLKGYGGSLNYQKYFPIFKTLYAYAGGRGTYYHGKQSYRPDTQIQDYKSENYALGVYGGITWFLSKRFALETSLLSANASYGKAVQGSVNNASYNETKSTSFNLSTSGAINDLGFKIYILF